MNVPSPRRWAESIAFHLILSAIAGTSYVLLVMGPGPLDPTNLSWFGSDAVNYYVGWGMFRRDHHMHWPLTFTNRIGYPIGESLAVLDAIPLFVLPLKLLAPLLPAAFQYFGIVSAIACSLQFFFALRLFRFLIGRGLAPILLSGAFPLLSPPLAFRLVAHYALTNQWLILAALLLFAKAVSRRRPPNFRRLVAPALVLAGCAVAINPYLAVMTLAILVSAIASLFFLRRLSGPHAAASLAALASVSLATAWAVGLVSAGSVGHASGFRLFSMNLLSPIDPGRSGASLLPALSLATAGQYEGYAYMGIGFLALAAIVTPFAIRRIRFDRVLAAQLGPLLLCSILLTLLALSTKITAGPAVLLDLDPHERLSPYFNVLRASGRFFWVPYYAILAAVLTAAFRLWRIRTATVLVALALVVQFVDTSRSRSGVRSEISRNHPSTLMSPAWSTLGNRYRHLIVLPAWQCDLDTPGGTQGFRYFGLLAAAQGMTINSYSSGRYSAASIAYECDTAVLEAVKRPLDAQSVYVVNPSIAAQINKGPSGPGHCHWIDGVLACSSAADTRLGPVFASPDF